MVEIYAAMAFEMMRERHAGNPRLQEEAFYQAYRESWWGRLRRAWTAKGQKRTAELPQVKRDLCVVPCDWCRDGQPAE